MARAKLKIAAIKEEKARSASFKRMAQNLIKKVHEFTILCNMAACLLIFNRDDNKMTVWPSPEVAKSLMDKFFALPFLVRNMKATDQASFINHNIELMEKKLAKARKVVNELEIDDLLLQLHMGHRKMVDLSKTEIKKLMTYAQEQIQASEKEIEIRRNCNTSVNETSFREEIGVPQANTAQGFNLNLVPSDGEDHDNV